MKNGNTKKGSSLIELEIKKSAASRILEHYVTKAQKKKKNGKGPMERKEILKMTTQAFQAKEAQFLIGLKMILFRAQLMTVQK